MAAILGVLAAEWMARGLEQPVRPTIWRVVLFGVAASRLSYVFQFLSAYLAEPWELLRVWDGGWDVQTGLIATGLYVLSVVQWNPDLKRPLSYGLGVTVVVWIVGTVGLSTIGDSSVPSQALRSIDGGVQALSQFNGKPTVINMWATWCPPCQREMPLLAKAQAEHPELNFVFLNQGESDQAVRDFMRRSGLNASNVLLDRKGLAGTTLGGGALPTTILIDSDGKRIGSHLGEVDNETLEKLIRQLKDRPSAARSGPAQADRPVASGMKLAPPGSSTPAGYLPNLI